MISRWMVPYAYGVMTIGILGPSRDIVKVVCVGSRVASPRVPQLPTEVWINKAEDQTAYVGWLTGVAARARGAPIAG